MNRLFNWFWMRKLWKKRENKEEGPINRLPNELMKLILDKLELDGDVKKLIRLRLVSTRWREMVEDYCARKKSMVVDMNQKDNNFTYRYIEKVFFGFANLKDFSILYLSTNKKSSKYLRSLLNLFPNIVQLSIRCHDHTKIDDLITYINSLASLTQLDLDEPLPNFSPLTRLSQTLSKLEHFSFEIVHLNDDEHHQLISNLGPSCVRVYFGVPFDYNRICQWHNINPNWLANVTHLRISTRFCESEKVVFNQQVVHYLSEHATSLKLLKIYFLGTIVGLALTSTAIRDLCKLAHLTELELRCIRIDIPELEQAVEQNRLISLSNVTCKLYGTVFSSIDGPWIGADRFTRVISIITPNLVELGIGGQIDGHFRAEMEQYLYRLPNLHKKIVYY